MSLEVERLIKDALTRIPSWLEDNAVLNKKSGSWAQLYFCQTKITFANRGGPYVNLYNRFTIVSILDRI